ncbi:carboxypeptidase-like regulatory domain-containing protein [Flavobacterium sp. DGU11]|uniref:Carboxypeptidase-like regulatory domain-containing protein n=1 Tax=Flavobacterium arundinis TaxID=3139143 RepID=A0ABU9HT43_9FLAO
MKKPIQISIPTPCHENWANMSPTDKGRFCASCQKTVRDFTQASDREIVEALKTGIHACGRFRASQLGRDLVIPKEKSKFWAAASAAAISLLVLGTNEVSAQTPVNTEQHETKTGNTDTNILPEGIKIITGTVLDEQHMPIPGANVKVKGNLAPGVQTDFDGLFSIKAKDGDVLVIEFIGMKTLTIKVSENGKYSVVMKDDTYLGDVFVGGISSGYDSSKISVASQYMFDY